jgi:Phytanoyl-CoA dioxygenase (PhyH)
MTTVDLRSRSDRDDHSVDLGTFVDEQLARVLEARGLEAGRAANRLGLVPLSFDVEGEQFTLVPEGGRLVVRRGAGRSLVAALDSEALSELVNDAVSTFGLTMSGRADIKVGSVDDFVAWEPVLRCLFDGRAVYEPGTIRFQDRDGSPLELQRSFTLNDDPDEIGHFLAEAGFLHIEGVFSEDEMAAVSHDLDDAITAAERDDGASWWAQTQGGEWYPARILGFNQKSPALRALLHSERFEAIGKFTDDQFVQRDPDIGDSAEGLLKKVQVIEGISDVSWHKDCAMGGHSRHCCGLTVGISVTGAGRENGELGVVPGSHRANIAPLGVQGLDLARLPLPTHTGDVTVHCSCTLHMSRPPVSAERRVVYTGFGLVPRPGDQVVELTPEEIRSERARLGDQVRSQQQRQRLSARTASFEL